MSNQDPTSGQVTFYEDPDQYARQEFAKTYGSRARQIGDFILVWPGEYPGLLRGGVLIKVGDKKVVLGEGNRATFAYVDGALTVQLNNGEPQWVETSV